MARKFSSLKLKYNLNVHLIGPSINKVKLALTIADTIKVEQNKTC